MDRIIGHNMTSFFRRELYLYALGDIRLQSPVSLRQAAITMAWFICWSGPIIWRFGVILNLGYALLTIGVPVFAAKLTTRPVFEGKTIWQATKSLLRYTQEPQVWNDQSPARERIEYYVDGSVWVSRRRELDKLRSQRSAHV